MSEKDYTETKANNKEFPGWEWQNRSSKGEPIVDFIALRKYRKETNYREPIEDIINKFIIGYEK